MQQFRANFAQERADVTQTNALVGGLVAVAALVIGVVVLSQVPASGPLAVPVELAGKGYTLQPTGSEPPSASTPDAEAGDPSLAADADGALGAADAPPLGDDQAGTDPMVDQSLGADPAAPDADPIGATPDTSTPAFNPADITVVVLNGTQEQGVAARATEAVSQAGFSTLIAANAKDLPPSAVLYRAGYEQAAAEVANVFGTELQGLVQPVDEAALPGEANKVEGAHVIVVLGQDGAIAAP